MTLQITKMLLPSSKHSLKCPNAMEPIGVTVHETGNKATAMAEISYMIGNDTSTSYHFAVDEERAVQGLPLNRNGFHSSDGSRGTGNAKTIGVEHCYNWNGKTTTKNDPKFNALYQKALANGIELIAQLFIDHPKWGVPQSGKNIFRHYDHSRKNCPQRMIEEGYWNTYVNRVKARYLELKNGGAVEKMAKTGKEMMKCINYLTIYTKPTRESKVLKTKTKDSNMLIEGYVYGEAVYGNNIWWYKVEGGYAFSGDFVPKIDQLYLDKSNNL